MNKKKSVKKMTFEPKIPTQKIEEVKHEDIPVPQDTQLVKGKFPPIQLQSHDSVYKYNPGDNIILNIPYDVEKADFLVFEDDTVGLRINGEIIRLDAVEVENDTVVEFGDGECNKICEVKYYLVPKDVII
ncbi:uncharacterized protein VNE69_08141 [Vairimorpha necatrix]|uniref:Uncharacterized protein n=1 Tax=Vairimorpha necatrix TaxID=6039 RepID=A0AAX4JF31_9MICR